MLKFFALTILFLLPVCAHSEESDGNALLHNCSIAISFVDRSSVATSPLQSQWRSLSRSRSRNNGRLEDVGRCRYFANSAIRCAWLHTRGGENNPSRTRRHKILK
jgi:hypothetical protein